MVDTLSDDDNPWGDAAAHPTMQGSVCNGLAPMSERLSIRTTEAVVEDRDSDTESDLSPAPEGCCEECREREGKWYCGACSQRYCERCWKKRPAHKRNHPESGNHMKMSHASHVHFESILRPQWNDTDRRDMHAKDMQSLWFAISSTQSASAGVDMDDFPRFSRLVFNHRQKHNIDVVIPRMVSFVGNTGAGKSTIIRMMLEKPWLTETGYNENVRDVPVVGDADATVATSGDVHLYAEAVSDASSIDRPIFYVDCEGFAGGAQSPAGSFGYAKEHAHSHSKAGSTAFTMLQQMLQYITGRGKKRTLNLSAYDSDDANIPTRDDVIGKLFPRLLYNFSDAVVFVIKEQRTLANRILEILNWASTSTTSALNRATRPRLIMVVNSAAKTNDWTSHSRRERFFEEHKDDINDPNIKALQEKLNYNIRNTAEKLTSLEDLFLVHYAKVDIVYIPHSHMRLPFATQLQELDQVIQDRSRESQEEKEEVGMLLQSQEQQQFFQLAFDHFFDNLSTNKPFNFLATLLKLRPIPHNVSNNIALLFEHVYQAKNCSGSAWTASEFLELTAPVVSSAIALNLDRSPVRLPGKLKDLFEGGADSDGEVSNTYAKQVKQAVVTFCNWKICEFQDGERKCVVAQLSHREDQHRDVKGDIISHSKFKSNFVHGARGMFSLWKSAFATAIRGVEDAVAAARHPLDSSSARSFSMPHSLRRKDDAIWNVHSNNLRRLYHQSHLLGDLTRGRLFVCYFCLHEIPLATLQCNHAICESCAKASVRFQGSNSENDERLISLSRCPLHNSPQHFADSDQIQLKPRYSGVRILTLDGGGVRGIIEVKMLQAVEKALGGKIPIQRFFDLIGGTSTGGLIALGIGTRDWTTAKCEALFSEVCKAAFVKHGVWCPADVMAYTVYGYLYQETPFEDKLKQILGDERLLGSQNSAALGLNSRVFITATKEVENRPTIFTNYIRAQDVDIEANVNSRPLYDYEMLHDETLQLKTWEVARATSAAPLYFRKFEKAISFSYWDGGLHHNNPAWIAQQEMLKIWPQLRNQYPDVLLSIGSAYQHLNNPPAVKEKTFWKRMTEWLGGFESLEVLKKTLLDNLDSEHTWRGKFGTFCKDEPDRYFRLNPECKEGLPELDDLEAFEKDMLEDLARDYLGEPEVRLLVENVARRLLTTTFYFEAHQSYEEVEDGWLFRGHIGCRFLDGSDDVVHFVEAIQKRSRSLRFKLKETGLYIGNVIDDASLEIMKQEKSFRVDNFVFTVPKDKHAFTIVLEAGDLTKSRTAPIGGCPWRFKD